MTFLDSLLKKRFGKREDEYPTSAEALKEEKLENV